MLTIFDIKRFAVHDGPGIRTTVFLKGCPLRCSWCHNPESQAAEPVSVDIERKLNGHSIKARKTYGEKVEEKELMSRLLRDRSFYEESGGGVSFSGGEPMVQIEGLEALLKSCREEGLHTALDTCGYVRKESFERVVDYTSLFLYDLKNMDVELHRKHTGVDNHLILSNADYLLQRGAKLIFRIPVIPGVNTGEEEMLRFLAYLKERKEQVEELHLLPYHRIAENKYRRLQMKAPPESIREPDQAMMAGLVKRFETTGLKIRVGG